MAGRGGEGLVSTVAVTTGALKSLIGHGLRAQGPWCLGIDAERRLGGGRVAHVHLTVGVSFHPGSPDVPLQGHPTVIDVPLPPTAENRGRYVVEAISRAPF